MNRTDTVSATRGRRRLFRAVYVAAVPLTLACGGMPLFGDPTEANAQVTALAKRLGPTTTKESLKAMVKEYPLLRIGGGAGDRVTIRTPPRFGADDWQVLLDFKPNGSLLRVGFGTTDYAPLR